MFCPQCRVEYRPGFTHCTDCDADLVYELPSESTRQSYSAEGTWDPKIIQAGEELRVAWEGDSVPECADACRRLQGAEITYRINESVAGRGPKMGRVFKYQVGVRTGDYEDARKALGYSEEADQAMWTEEELESGAAELPARDDQPVKEVHGDWNSSNWFPEDATAEVWNGGTNNSGSTIEMSLRENRINYRTETQGNQPARIFVMPGDEARAREIVREVVEGVPPE